MIQESRPEIPTSMPAFFRHLPKTAGTSLITTLSNVYGDAHCHRFKGHTKKFREEFADVLADRGETLSLVTGHIPLGMVEEGVCGPEFTVLREPIARLLSMRRFLEGLPEAERARLRLGDRVTVGDLLTSQHPEIYSQVRNGVTRFYCGNHAYADAKAPAFWERTPAPEVIQACAHVLERMVVGTAENMAATLCGIGRMLRVPYDLETPIENTTSDRDDDVSLEDIRALAEANTADIAVYHHVKKRLLARSPTRGHACGSDYDPRTLFDPQPGEPYDPQWIPGRQGFTACEPLVWIGPTGRGRIHLTPSDRSLVLSFVLYGVVPHYPMDDIVFTIDGCPWPREFRHGSDHTVFALAAIPPHAGPVELAITQPCAVPVYLVEPESPDRRTLGVALAKVLCEAG